MNMNKFKSNHSPHFNQNLLLICLLKQYLYDCIPKLFVIALWLIAVPILIYSPIDYSISKNYVGRILLLRWFHPICTLVCFSYTINWIKRFISILLDMKQLKYSQSVLNEFSIREEHFGFFIKLKRLCIDSSKTNFNWNLLAMWWNLNLSYINEFLLDTRVCGLNELQRIQRKMRKHGRKYSITYLKHSRIITSIRDIDSNIELYSVENSDII